MLHRWLTMAFCVGGLVLLSLAVLSYSAFVRGPALAVEQADLAIGDVSPGRDAEVLFHLRNDSGRPIRVLGVAECCGVNCRLVPKRRDLFDLPPGSGALECSLTVYGPGPFNGQLHLFADDDGLRETILTVQGTAEAAPPLGEK